VVPSPFFAVAGAPDEERAQSLALHLVPEASQGQLVMSKERQRQPPLARLHKMQLSFLLISRMQLLLRWLGKTTMQGFGKQSISTSILACSISD
jgi:hypothetical protein